ncbi:hypothetical protein [Pelagibacterium halotolerans]|uniref:Uncharacterized protein n=1 Tax=Pelagibacterium halotolerans (strain DSM 22347 / JCM 15775 / CGMCC 1.7692 / B2) TaxID=1082931 RepID=G4RDC9_PELHB|nr:hypothetical protein [Pelagibacterium halotolerans]AEQ50755.1 hypothetical protein KKY_716 [Pelagibacterium halotolerans B2]QJR19325.1 hypothetical protein HKM20_13280 [Pelagibacterium halotolerans]SDZ94952.1 hypothetical protein SAMN05428936_101642 [Pelagibacterium halotolerans]
MIDMKAFHAQSGTRGRIDGQAGDADGRLKVRIKDRRFFADEIVCEPS